MTAPEHTLVLCPLCGHSVRVGTHNNNRGRAIPCVSDEIKARLKALRREIRAERISQGDLIELQNLVPYIEPGDVELAQWAGIPEEDFHNGAYREPGYDASARTAELAAEEDAIFAERKAALAADGPFAIEHWDGSR